MMSELEKLENGLEHCYKDDEILAIRKKAIKECAVYNAIDHGDYDSLYKQLKHMLKEVGEDVYIAPNFHCDDGKKISIGDDFTANYNFTVLDVYNVNIGSHVMIGPNTLITSVTHPLSPKKRREHISVLGEVNIGDDVWIGGNVTILPGVTIGNNVVIGAGAVVNRDIPDNSLAVGVPARVIKTLENDL